MTASPVLDQQASRGASPDGDSPPAPPFPVGQPTRASWREGTVTRANEIDALCAWLVAKGDIGPSEPLISAIRAHSSTARHAAEQSTGWWRSVSGSTVERTASNLDAAEADLLRLAPPDYVGGQLPNLVAHVRRHLPADDPRRLRMEHIAEEGAVDSTRRLTAKEHDEIVGIVRAASSESARENMRARSFRNVLVVTALVLTVLAVSLAVFGARSPRTIPLCFGPEQGDQRVVVCPTRQTTLGPISETPSPDDPDIDDAIFHAATGADLVVVEGLGLAAAALAAAAGLRGIRGTSTPFGIPIALAVLKLPSGALTAFLGLLLMRGQFFPGLSALDSSAQILAWAVVFGYAQQLFTRLVDQQAHDVLDAVRGGDRKKG